MTSRPDAQERLEQLLVTLPKPTHQTAQDYHKPIEAFIDIYDSGDIESLHPDTMRDWALSKGWNKSDARDLGEMADSVMHTMRSLESRGRLR
jgi:hypothetical protein